MLSTARVIRSTSPAMAGRPSKPSLGGLEVEEEAEEGARRANSSTNSFVRSILTKCNCH